MAFLPKSRDQSYWLQAHTWRDLLKYLTSSFFVRQHQLIWLFNVAIWSYYYLEKLHRTCACLSKENQSFCFLGITGILDFLKLFALWTPPRLVRFSATHFIVVANYSGLANEWIIGISERWIWEGKYLAQKRLDIRIGKCTECLHTTPLCVTKSVVVSCFSTKTLLYLRNCVCMAFAAVAVMDCTSSHQRSQRNPYCEKAQLHTGWVKTEKIGSLKRDGFFERNINNHLYL